MGDDRFVEEHRAFVLTLARRVQAELELRCELDDLIAYGMTGLLQARARFDPTRGVQFNTFAYYRVRGAILDGVRKMAYLPASTHRRLRLAEATNSLTEPLAGLRAAAQAEGGALAPEARARALEDVAHRIAAGFVLTCLGSEEEDPSARGPEEALADTQQAERVRALVRTLPPNERAVIEGFYFHGKRLDDVGAEIGLSKSWASRLHNKALHRLRAALEKP
jgi:RNA polymerase sigma factor FliA